MHVLIFQVTREATWPRETGTGGKEGEGGVEGLVAVSKIDIDIPALWD